MDTHVKKTQENRSQAIANNLAFPASISKSTYQFADNRPEVIAQRALQEAVNNSPMVKQLKVFQLLAQEAHQLKSSILVTPEAVKKTKMQFASKYENKLTDNLNTPTDQMPVSIQSSNNDILQRVQVPGTQLDTDNIDHYDEIYQWLRDKDTNLNDLKYLSTLLQVPMLGTYDPYFSLYYAIFEQIRKREAFDTLYEKQSDSPGTVWTSAEVSFDGYPRILTEPVMSGTIDMSEMYTLDKQTGAASAGEMHISRGDSEVATLGDVYQQIIQFLNYSYYEGSIKIIIHGSMGPCNGCKERIKKLITDLAELTKTSSQYSGVKFIECEVRYYNKKDNVDRGGQPTTYGYADDVQSQSQDKNGYKYNVYTKINPVSGIEGFTEYELDAVDILSNLQFGTK